MNPLRSVARQARSAYRAARFRAWAARLGLEVRRDGGRLELDAPHGADMEELPVIRARLRGEGDGTLTLRIGRGVTFGRRCAIEVWAQATNVLELGDEVLIEDDVKLLLHGGTIRLGAKTQLRDYARLKSKGDLVLGERAIVSQQGMVHCSERIELDDCVGLAERVTVIDSDHGFDGSDRYFLDAPLKTAPVRVGRNVFVATGAVVTRGVSIGANAVVGAGAMVLRGEYPGGWLMMGTPATPQKPLAKPVAPADGTDPEPERVDVS